MVLVSGQRRRRLPRWVGAVAAISLTVTGCSGSASSRPDPSVEGASSAGSVVTLVPPPSEGTAPPSCFEPALDNRPYKFADHTDFDRLASDVDALLAAGGLPGYAGLYADGPEDKVHVYLVGPVPAALRQIAGQARHAVLVVHPARFTLQQMNAAMMRVVNAQPSVSAPGGYMLAKVGPCEDGSGIRVTIFNVHHADRAPISVPDAITARVKSLTGTIPALVQPGTNTVRLV
jgi:hypothetical protein